jgi:hypothetical protein
MSVSSSAIKISLNQSQKTSVKAWLKRLRRLDPNFSDVPKARFGTNYVKLDVWTAIALMPWVDPNTSGDIDAFRFKKDALKAIWDKYLNETSPWRKQGLLEAFELVCSTPMGEYVNELPTALANR